MQSLSKMQNDFVHLSPQEMIELNAGGALSDLLVDCYIYATRDDVTSMKQAAAVRVKEGW